MKRNGRDYTLCLSRRPSNCYRYVVSIYGEKRRRLGHGAIRAHRKHCCAKPLPELARRRPVPLGAKGSRLTANKHNLQCRRVACTNSYRGVLRQLCGVRRQMPTAAVDVLVCGRFDYCNSLLVRLPAEIIQRLQQWPFYVAAGVQLHLQILALHPPPQFGVRQKSVTMTMIIHYSRSLLVATVW